MTLFFKKYFIYLFESERGGAEQEGARRVCGYRREGYGSGIWSTSKRLVNIVIYSKNHSCPLDPCACSVVASTGPNRLSQVRLA